LACRDRRVDIPGAEMEQRGESKTGKRTGIWSYTVHLLFPGYAEIRKGVVLDRSYSREQTVLKAMQLFRLPPIREKYVEIAPEEWNKPDENEVTMRFRYDRKKLSTLQDLSLE
jgi:hypothetical protein